MARIEAAPPDRPEDRTKWPRPTRENTRQIIQSRGGEMVEMWGKKSHGGTRALQKMLKMKVDPEMYMKTKERATICPTQKTIFLPGCTSIYTEMHVVCWSRRLFCHCWSAWEPIHCFRMWKLESRNAVRPYGRLDSAHETRNFGKTRSNLEC